MTSRPCPEPPAAGPAEDRFLILAPHGRDARVIATLFEAEGIRSLVCADADGLLQELAAGAAAVILTEEMLAGGFDGSIGHYLGQQPSWSDLPFIVLAMRQPGRRSARALASLRELGNLVLLERPLNPESLVSAAHSALRARRRQYQTRRHLQDIETAKQTVERLNAELELRIAARTADLAGANDRLMREIAERERMQANVVQGQKLEAIGRLTGGIAHDFNNLLHVVNLNLQFIARLAPDHRLATYARRARESVDRGARLTSQLLSFARAKSLLPRLQDVNTLIGNLRELIDVSVGSKIAVVLDLCPGEAPVMLDGGQLEMALLNMAVNSRDAMPQGGRLTLRTRIEGYDGHRQVLVSVEDDGEGIAPAVLSKVFDPFFTTKPNGQGTGLGLSQVYGFANQSGGSAEIRSTPGQGTTVTLRFKLATRSAAAASQAPGPAFAAGSRDGHHREILVVEDDAGVREGIAEGLRLLQYTVREACDGASGLQQLRERRPDLLMVDYLMPGLNGAELVAAARRLYPNIPILLATGYADMEEVGKVVTAQSILTKPFDLETLGNAVGRELARERPAA